MNKNFLKNFKNCLTSLSISSFSYVFLNHMFKEFEIMQFLEFVNSDISNKMLHHS